MKDMIYAPAYFWDGISDIAQKQMAVVVSKEKIQLVGTILEVQKQYPDIQIGYYDNWLMIPSFTDAHDHGRAVSPVGYSVSDRCLEMWLQDLGKIPAVPHYLATYYDGLNLAASGVTTVLHSHNPNKWSNLQEELVDAARGYNEAGIRCIICPPYIDQNKGVYDKRQEFIASLPKTIGEKFSSGIHDQIFTLDEYFKMIAQLRKTLQLQIEKEMVEIQLHPNGGQWCSDTALLAMKEYAITNDMRIHMHLLETKYQYIYAQRKWGCSFIQHYKEIGFLGPWVSFAHTVWLTKEDMKILAESGAMIVTNPSSNLRLKSGTAPLKSMVEAGVIVGLGLDGCSFDDDQDYLREIRVAWFNMEVTGVDGGIDKMIPLKMATVNGAKISGEKLSSGVIKKGVKADFVCINISQLRKPYADIEADILELLVQRGTKKSVENVFVNGEVVYSLQEESCRIKMSNAEQKLTDAIVQLRQTSHGLPDKQELIMAVYDFYKSWEEEI